MGPHHHQPEECEEDRIDYSSSGTKVLLRVCKVEGLVPNTKVECEEILPNEQNVHQDHCQDALRVPDAPAWVCA